MIQIKDHYLINKSNNDTGYIKSFLGDNTTMIVNNIILTFCRYTLCIDPGKLRTEIQVGTGYFELCLNKQIVLSGNVYTLNEYKSKYNKTTDPNAFKRNNRCPDGNKPLVSLSHEEIYSGFEEYDYCVGDKFKTINRVDIFQDGLFTVFG